MSGNIDALLVKAAPVDEKSPPGLFHVVVEITEGRETYLLLPVTDRMFPLSLAQDKQRFSSLQDIAIAIAGLDKNTEVYAANPEEFIIDTGETRRLKDEEIIQLRNFLSHNKER